jgi:hypothetical protein
MGCGHALDEAAQLVHVGFEWDEVPWCQIWTLHPA